MSNICENHEWVHSNQMLCSNPPQQDRICKKCGKEDRVTLGTLTPFEDTYGGVIKKFRGSSKSEVKGDNKEL